MSDAEKRRQRLQAVLADVQNIGSDIDNLRRSYGSLGNELQSAELRALLAGNSPPPRPAAPAPRKSALRK